MAMWGLFCLLLIVLSWPDVKKAFLVSFYKGKLKQLEERAETFDKIQSTALSEGYRRRLELKINKMKLRLYHVTGKE